MDHPERTGRQDPIEDWDSPQLGQVLRLGNSDTNWARLAKRYYPPYSICLGRCLQVARDNGAKSVVIETHYYDADYRSEYSTFYSRLYEPRASTTHRLHFFKSAIGKRPLWDLGVDPNTDDYIGYVVVRPAPFCRVGRTVLTPPPALANAVRTSIVDHVMLFGQPFKVRGVPFMQQDARLNRCAHTSAWMAHYSAFRRGDVARRPVAEFSIRAEPSHAGRQAPSNGLTDDQLVALLRDTDLPPHIIDLSELGLPLWAQVPADPVDAGLSQSVHTSNHSLPWDATLDSAFCRYLNSGLPVIVAARHHTFVVCGYDRQGTGDDEHVRFIRHDDNVGPYVPVGSPYLDISATGDVYSPWRFLIAPVPEELWLTPDMAEHAAAELVQGAVERAAQLGEDLGSLPKLLEAGEISLRTYVDHNNDFKRKLVGRVELPVLRAYRLARLPRYVWVVEVIDKRRRSAGDGDCVIGEFIIDAISGDIQPLVLAMHLPGAVQVWEPDGRIHFRESCSRTKHYSSGGVGPA